MAGHKLRRIREQTLLQDVFAGTSNGAELYRRTARMVRLIAMQISAQHGVPVSTLLKYGMTHFNAELNNYFDLHEFDVGPWKQRFTVYFKPCARESMLTYLGISKRPADGIPPRRIVNGSQTPKDVPNVHSSPR